MSKVTPLPYPLGPTSAVLDDLTLHRLPEYLSGEARQALRNPSDDLVLAAVSVGQLLRVGAVRGPARERLMVWLSALSGEAVGVLGGVGEQLLAEAASALGSFLATSPEAREMLEEHAGFPEVEDEPATRPTQPRPTSSPTGWLPDTVLARDRAESLLVLLGKVAMRGPEDTAGSAEHWERSLRQQARSLDETAIALSPLLGDHLTPAMTEDPWLRRASFLQADPWWMALPAARLVGRRPAGQRGEAAPPLTTAAGIVLQLPRRLQPVPSVAQAAHSGTENRPPSEGVQRVRRGPLRMELARLADPEAPGDFSLSLWLEDGSLLTLEGDAVRLLDAQDQPCTPISLERKPRRWWGYFRGEGRFQVRVEGHDEPIVFDVTREM